MKTLTPEIDPDHLRMRIVDSFKKSDARCAAFIGLDAMEPHAALENLAWIREWLDAIFPGISEQLIPKKTEQAAINWSKKKKIQAA